MFFDAKEALARIQGETAATPATPATFNQKAPQSSGSSGSSSPHDPENAILEAIKSGAQRHGAVATDTRLGTTVTYQLLDKLIEDGRVVQGRDGILKLKEVSP